MNSPSSPHTVASKKVFVEDQQVRDKRSEMSVVLCVMFSSDCM